jgi:pimeloyl-ACP methyl ester carboxylesterase
VEPPSGGGAKLVARASGANRTRIARVVAGSLAAGLAVAVILPFVPMGTPDENFSPAMVLIGFAIGWALLAILSTRLTDQPQRWAVAPAVFMGVAGAIVLLAPDTLVDALGWVWPPALLVLVVWMLMRAKRDLRSRPGRWLLTPVLAVLVLASVGGGHETLSRAAGDDAYALRGQLVDVGPYRLHLECSGSGAPTVILEPGGGASAATLAWIAPAAARDSRVCIYDRAGRGWSDAATSTPDGAQIATDLHTLLNRAHVPGPYVLVGHSFGGLYVMSYAAQYPDEVAGLLLVDSTAPKSTPVSPQQAGSYDPLRHFSSLVSTTARLGIGRIIAQSGFRDLPPQSRNEARASAAAAKEMSSFLDEFAIANRSASQAGQLSTLGEKPLVVLTAELGNSDGWIPIQDKLADLSTNSVHRIVKESTHDSLVSNPAHAAAVNQAINAVIMAVRTDAPLAGR